MSLVFAWTHVIPLEKARMKLGHIQETKRGNETQSNAYFASQYCCDRQS